MPARPRRWPPTSWRSSTPASSTYAPRSHDRAERGTAVTTRYRAAIIGCGDIGHAHAQGYLANPEVELLAVVDPVEPARRQFQAEYGAPEAYGSVAEMFAACRPD